MDGSIHDRFEITEILHRHQIAIDQRDGDAYAALFAPDGRFESPFASAVGTSEIKRMTLSLHESGFTEDKRHYLGPLSVELDGERARAISYWWVADTADAPRVFATGRYVDELRKTDGTWRIVHRRQEADQSPARDDGSAAGS